MVNKNTLLIGQVLQIRDKLIAKRHCIPASMQDEWNDLVASTDCYDAGQTYHFAVKGQATQKPDSFANGGSDLSTLVSALKDFNAKVTKRQLAH